MSVLSDRDIRWCIYCQRIGIDPYDDARVQPASVDLTLANEWMAYQLVKEPMWPEPLKPDPIDMDDVKRVQTIKTVADEFTLWPHQLVLCSTVEHIEMPNDIQGQVHGKSSLGRIGLMVHITAGFVDPGFKGKITLEMFNANHTRPIILRAGKPVCQISFTEMTSRAVFPYGHKDLKSKYQNQTGVQGSLYEG